MTRKLFMALCFFIGCGATQNRLPEIPSETQIVQESQLEALQQGQQPLLASDRLVIFDANVAIETSNPDSVQREVTTIAIASGGYVLESARGQISIRIPSKSFHTILEQIDKLGNTIEKSIKGKDITEEYRDLEVRLDNLEKSRQRYLELLAMAQNVADALKIEKELERLSRDIDRIKGRLNRLSHLEQFSTITLKISLPDEGLRPGPVGYVFVGVYKFFKFLFVRD